MTEHETKEECPTAQGVHQANGILMGDHNATQRGMEYPRPGVETSSASAPQCSLSTRGTNSMCMMRTPGHAITAEYTRHGRTHTSGCN
jgi:hypothetical protein